MNEKGRQTKLLAAIAILAMVICALAVVMPSSEVNAEEISVSNTAELAAAINSAQEDDIIILTGSAYGQDEIVDDTYDFITYNEGFTIFEIDKSLTIKAADANNKPTIYGSFGVQADRFTLQDVNLNPKGGTNAPGFVRNAITFLGDELTISGCTITLGTDGSFANGVSFFPASTTSSIDIAGSTFNGFVNSSGGYSSTAVNIATEWSPSNYFPGAADTADLILTENDVMALYNDNTFTNCRSAITYHNYNGTTSDYSDDSGYVIVNQLYNGGEGLTTIIPTDTTVTFPTDEDDQNYSTSSNATIINNGTLKVLGGQKATISEGTILYNNGTITGTIVNNGTIINNQGTAITVDETSTGSLAVPSTGGTVLSGTSIGEEAVTAALENDNNNVVIINGVVDIPDNFVGTIRIQTGGIAHSGEDNPIIIGIQSTLVVDQFGENSAQFYFKNSETSTSAVVLDSFQGKDVTISFGSIVVGGTELKGTISVGADETLELTGASTEPDGTTNLTITMADGSNLEINNNVVVESGSTLAINGPAGDGESASAVLNDRMSMAVNGTITLGDGVTFDARAGSFTGSGTITVGTGSTFIYTAGTLGNVKMNNTGGTVDIRNGFGIENTIRGTVTLEGTNNYLANDIIIEEGATLVISRNAALDLRGFDLDIRGTLIIERNGTIYSSVYTAGSEDNSKLMLKSTGTITNNSGIIGSDSPVMISNGENSKTTTDAQYVEMQGVQGVSISLVRSLDGEGNRVYGMHISGDVSRISSVDEHILTIANVVIDADMTIGSGIVFTVADSSTVTVEDVVLTHNGAFMDIDGTLVLQNGASFIVNSPVAGLVTVETGLVGDNNTIATEDMDTTSVGFNGALVPVSGTQSAYYAGVVGMTISVDRVTIPNTDGTSSVYQRMYVNGSLEVETQPSTNVSQQDYPKITMTGPAYVDGDLFIASEVVVNNTDDYYFDLSAGTITAEADEGLKYSGASYSVETAGDNNQMTETFYYTDFATAMGQIGNAKDGLITIAGDFEITGTFAVGDDQEIAFADAAYGYADEYNDNIVVGEAGEITVTADGTIANDAFNTIEGRVIVLEGVGYRPSATAEPSIYAVMTVDSETNDTTYSGFKIALDNAQSGQTVTVVGDATYDGNLVIPDGVTVDVDMGVGLKVTGNVTVETGGKLILDNQSVLTVGKNGRDASVSVAGELDASEGGTIAAAVDTITQNGAQTSVTANVDIYSTGTTTFRTGNTFGNNVEMNAAYYDDGELVYTSVANAVAYASENALLRVYAVGTFSETGAIEADSVSIVIMDGANVTLGDITLNNATIGPQVTSGVKGTGQYTANVTGLSGAGDAAVDSTVSVSRTTAIVSSTVTLNAEGVNQYKLAIDDVVGATTVSAGTVAFTGDDMTISRTNVLTIVDGATLVIGESSTVSVTTATEASQLGANYLRNNGTIQIDGILAVNNINYPNDYLVLSGNVIVSETGTLDVNDMVTITGDLVIEADGTFTVGATLNVGDAPDYLGDSVTGTVIGEIVLEGDNYIMVYAGASIADATIDSTETPETTQFVINGTEFVTVYTFNGSMGVSAIESSMRTNLTDLDFTTGDIVWYAEGVEVNEPSIGDYAVLSTELHYRSIIIVASIGTHVTLSVDNIIVTPGASGYYPLSIGTHTVSVVIDPGYSGDVTITFNGQTIQNGGTIEVTADMAGQNVVLSAVGQLTQDSGSGDITVNTGSGDMSLTDILLIVLVILILVMAIIVALRLMRS